MTDMTYGRYRISDIIVRRDNYLILGNYLDNLNEYVMLRIKISEHLFDKQVNLYTINNGIYGTTSTGSK